MKRVLIVEDEVQIASVLRDVLEEEGYHTHIAYNGRVALEIIDQFRPDLIISDVMMPRMTGPELGRALASHPKHFAIPLILMSAGPPPPRTAEHPYTLFIAKPFDIDMVLAALASVLKAGDDSSRAG